MLAARRHYILHVDFQKNMIPIYFLTFFSFLTQDKKGPVLISGKGLELAQAVIKFGPTAPENFMQAWKFAVSKDGFNFKVEEALAFSRRLAERSSAGMPENSK